MGKLEQVICGHNFACNWQQPFLNKSAEGRRVTVEIISWSISTKVWYRAGIELATPGSAVRHASVARHVTDCATRPGIPAMRANTTKSTYTFTSVIKWVQIAGSLYFGRLCFILQIIHTERPVDETVKYGLQVYMILVNWSYIFD